MVDESTDGLGGRLGDLRSFGSLVCICSDRECISGMVFSRHEVRDDFALFEGVDSYHVCRPVSVNIALVEW